MIKFSDSTISQILPEALAGDPGALALGHALHKQISRLIRCCAGAGIYAAVDQLPARMLDLLAKELRTQYYKTSLPLSVRRRLVRNTLIWYTRAGTPAAVNELIEIAFGSGKAIDWYEYGGRPGYFKVATNNTAVTGERLSEFLDLLERIKRKSAWLEGIEIGSEGSVSLNHFTGYHELEWSQNMLDLSEWNGGVYGIV